MSDIDPLLTRLEGSEAVSALLRRALTLHPDYQSAKQAIDQAFEQAHQQGISESNLASYDPIVKAQEHFQQTGTRLRGLFSNPQAIQPETLEELKRIPNIKPEELQLVEAHLESLAQNPPAVASTTVTQQAIGHADDVPGKIIQNEPIRNPAEKTTAEKIAELAEEKKLTLKERGLRLLGVKRKTTLAQAKTASREFYEGEASLSLLKDLVGIRDHVLETAAVYHKGLLGKAMASLTHSGNEALTELELHQLNGFLHTSLTMQEFKQIGRDFRHSAEEHHSQFRSMGYRHRMQIELLTPPAESVLHEAEQVVTSPPHPVTEERKLAEEVVDYSRYQPKPSPKVVKETLQKEESWLIRHGGKLAVGAGIVTLGGWAAHTLAKRNHPQTQEQTDLKVR